MPGDRRVGEILSTVDETRRFNLIAGLVLADPARVRATAASLLAQTEIEKRTLGVDLLGQLATVSTDSRPEIAEQILDALGMDDAPGFVAACVIALGHAEDARAREAVVRLADHPDPEVRFAVAFAMPIIALDDEAADALRRLSGADEANCAKFGEAL